ncbi:MAG: DUF4124 domain-containing protein [Candidatus Thiodiazotropha sp. (ex Lucinoma kastoroae)]|nr:DUF4124 domain-containing protein [Candidatus Thiodiazotropha sp. (ex Rostrolucina anterorostrata)]MCU7847691.1 DUF4124 domain-containing protein [Candidatus Thiodiazotropha sp. (ex Lucinoma kastoroae)]MCU7859927.1 DUF4124 domain-containing protein [Candidatus Thiodiazotropha sp. (ex Lucinoma kastoroae)]
MDIRVSALLATFMILPMCIQAGDVYRSVDSEGNVTYTDAPQGDDASAEKIELHPGPSAESILETKERNAAIRQAMEEAQEKRMEKKASREERMAKAGKELDEAEEMLSKTKEFSDDDRQTFVSGKSRIRPEYYERVKEAEAVVEAARKRFKALRGY